jgi:DNA-binding MarR family transcriptional regulator
MHRSFCDFKQFMDSSGLSTSQVSTLMKLYHGGPEGVSTISEHLGVTPAAASQLVERLVQQGMVDRSEDPADRRARQLILTPKARSLIEAGIDLRRRWLENLAFDLSPGEQENLTRSLEILVEAARQKA